MCCFLLQDVKHIIYGLITLREMKTVLSFSFFFKQRGTLKEIIIMNECRIMIEVEQSLKQSQSRYNQGL